MHAHMYLFPKIGMLDVGHFYLHPPLLTLHPFHLKPPLTLQAALGLLLSWGRERLWAGDFQWPAQHGCM